MAASAAAALDPLYEAAKRPFLDLAPELAGSLLYLDTGAAEVVSTSLGLPFLLGLGVTSVCSLEDAAPSDALLSALHGAAQGMGSSGTPCGPSTLAIGVTRLLTDVHETVVRAVSLHIASVRRVIILSSVSEHAHACQAATVLGVEAFSEYTAMLQEALQAISEAPLQLSVRHVPMNMCVLDASTLVLPAASAAACLARSGPCAAGYTHPDSASARDQDGEGASDGLSLLAHALGGVVCQLGARLETFYVGGTAQLLAQEVSSLPLPTPPEVPGRPSPTLALVLVDRALDLVTPCSHSDHPLDLALAAVPRTPSAHSVSAATSGAGTAPPLVWGSLDMRSTLPTPLPRLCPSEGDGNEHARGSEEHGGPESDAGQGEAQGAGAARGAGSAGVQVELLNATDRQSMQRLERLISSRPKDALQLLRKWLKEGLRAERLTASVRSRAGMVPVSELQALIGDLTGTTTPGAAGVEAGAAETEAGAATGAAAGAGAGEGEGRRLLRHRGLLSLAAAVAEASAGPLAPRWEAAGALERQALQLMVQAGDVAGMHSMLLDALANAQHGKGPLLISDILQLLPFLYSLWPDACPPGDSDAAAPGPFSPQQRKELGEALTRAVVSALAAAAKGQHQHERQGGQAECIAQLDCFSSAWLLHVQQVLQTQGQQAARKEVQSRLQAFMQRLPHASQARASLNDLSRVTASDLFADTPVSQQPILKQLVQRILRGEELPDLSQPSSSGALSGLISKGLGRFGLPGFGAMNPSRPHHPGSCTAVLVFVVGGVSAAEVRAVRQEVAEAAAGASGPGATPQLLLGGTSLVSPCDVCRQLLV